jgi:sugar transferase (PEP-CTERM/EpsH1 system associated)
VRRFHVIFVLSVYLQLTYVVNLTRGYPTREMTPAAVINMRIFFVCQRVPFPPDRGDKIVTFQEVRHLSQRHEVHVFCLADGADDLANVAGVVEHAASVTAVPVTKLRGRLRSLLALGSRRPLSVAAFDEAKLHDAIIRKYDEARPDLIIVFSCNVAQYAEHFAGVPRIMQFHDLDSLKWVQFATFKNVPLKWIYQTEAKRLFAYERSIARRFSLSLVCNTAERDDFERLFPGIEVSLVGNGVDLDHFRPSVAKKRPGSMMFTGVMDYFPNVDGVLWFCDEVLPRVQSRVPEASLTICGNRPTAAIIRLAKRRGVSVTGWVPDTRPYLDSAEVCVAPLRVGRGVQNKLLEALAMGLPCVASYVAWRGTAVPKGASILVSDDAAEFAEHVTQLLQVATLRMDMAAKARAAVETMYRWEPQLAALDSVIAAVTAWPRKRRTPCSSHTPPGLDATVQLPAS